MTVPSGEAASAQQRRRALAVDDVPEMRLLLRSAVGALGYDVTTAADGAEAIRLLEQGGPSFDIVLTDLNMPEANGIDVLRALRTRHTSTCGILLTSFLPDDFTRQEAERLRAKILLKPFTLEQLRQLIAEGDPRSDPA